MSGWGSFSFWRRESALFNPALGDLPAPEVVAAFMQVMEKMRSLKSRDATRWQPRTLSA
jgi:hypothetical protein